MGDQRDKGRYVPDALMSNGVLGRLHDKILEGVMSMIRKEYVSVHNLHAYRAKRWDTRQPQRQA